MSRKEASVAIGGVLPGEAGGAAAPQPAALQIDIRILMAQRFMRSNIHRRLRLGEVSAVVWMSVSRFAHLFRDQTGIAPGEWLKSMRLRQAKALLETATLSVKEIGALVGMDSSSLAREFRQAYGSSPARHRARTVSRQSGLAEAGKIHSRAPVAAGKFRGSLGVDPLLRACAGRNDSAKASHALIRAPQPQGSPGDSLQLRAQK